MHLFRFLSWNLISYILCWGGELKILIWQEVVATTYYIGLYFLAPFLPVNIYLTYALITLPVIAQTILGLVIFKRKNWMKKLSEDNKIKVVVFDFDDTLYSGVDWTPWDKFCLKGLEFLFKDLPDEEFKIIKKRVEDNSSTDSAVINELILAGRKPIEWLEYRDNNNCDLDYSVCKITSNDTIQSFAEKYVLYIVTNSTKKDLENTAKILNLDLSSFKEIIVNKYENNEMSKKVLYKYVLDKEKISPNEMYVIGNSLKSDIQPALDLSIKGKVIEHADFELKDFEL